MAPKEPRGYNFLNFILPRWLFFRWLENHPGYDDAEMTQQRYYHMVIGRTGFNWVMIVVWLLFLLSVPAFAFTRSHDGEAPAAPASNCGEGSVSVVVNDQPVLCQDGKQSYAPHTVNPNADQEAKITTRNKLFMDSWHRRFGNKVSDPQLFANGNEMEDISWVTYDVALFAARCNSGTHMSVGGRLDVDFPNATCDVPAAQDYIRTKGL